jgi:hypothetical protein
MTIDNDALAVQIEDLKQCAEGNRRALRGYDGEIGLVGKVAGLETSIFTLKTSDLPHMEGRIMTAIKTQAEKNVTWPSLGKGLVAPIGVAVITAVLVSVIHSIFF